MWDLRMLSIDRCLLLCCKTLSVNGADDVIFFLRGFRCSQFLFSGFFIRVLIFVILQAVV